MALEKTKLVVEIETTTKGAKDIIKKLKKDVESLGDTTVKSTRQSSKALTALADKYKSLAIAATGANQSMELLNKGLLVLDATAGAAVDSFASFETALVGVQKTTDLSGQRLEQFSRVIQEMSTTIPVSANELLNLGQIAGQLGVRGSENIRNFSETIAKVSVSTNLMGEEAATAFTRILNVTNTGIDQIDEFGSVVVRLGNNFAATESEIVRMTNEVARSIGVFGASAAQAAAIGTAMKSLGIQAQLGGSAMGKLLRTLDKVSRNGGAAMEQLTFLTGESAEAFRKGFEKDAVSSLEKFLKGLNRVQKAGGSAAKTLEGFGLSGDEVNKVLPAMAARVDVLSDALLQAGDEMKNSTALNEEAKKAFATLESQMKIADNALTNFSSSVGELLAPALTSVLEMFVTFITSLTSIAQALGRVDFSGLAKSGAELVAILTGAGGIIFGLKMVQGQLLAMKVGLIGPFDVLATNIKKATVQLKLFTAQMKKAALAGLKLAATATAITLLVASLEILVRNVQQLDKVWDVMTAGFQAGINKMLINLKKAQIAFIEFREKFGLADNAVQDIAILNVEIQKLASESEALGDKLSKSLEKIDTGFTGKAIEELIKLMRGLGESADKGVKNEIDKTVQKLEEARRKALELTGILSLRNIGRAAANFFNDMLDFSTEIKSRFKELTIGGQGGFEAAGNIFIEQSKKAGNTFKDAILDANIGKIFSGFMGALKNFASLFDPDNINKFADMLTNILDELPNLIISAFESLDDILVNFIDKFPGVLEEFLARLPGVFQSILDKLPALIETILDAIVTIVDALPNMIQRIIDKLPEMAQKIFDALPGIIDAIFEALPLIIGSLIREIPGQIEQLLEALPDIIESLIAGIIGAVDEIVVSIIDTFINKGGIVRIISAIVKASNRITVSILKGLARGLQRIFASIFKGIKVPSPNMDTDKLEKDLKDSVNKIGKAAQKAGAELFSVVDIKDVKRRSGLGDGSSAIEDFQGMIDNGIEQMSSLWQQFLDGLKAAWMWVWENTIQPITDIVKEAWMWVWTNVLEPIVNLVADAWNWVVVNVLEPLAGVVSDAWQWVVDKVLKPLQEVGQKSFEWVKEKIVDPLLTIGKDSFTWVNDKIVQPLLTVGKDSFTWVKKNIVDKLKGIFDGEGTKGVTNAFSKLGDALGKVIAPFKSLGDAMDSIIEPFKKLADARGSLKMPGGGGGGGGGGALDPGGFISSATGGKVSLPSIGASGGLIPSYASGGPIPMGSRGSNDGLDDQLIAAQSGEFMIRRAAVQQIGASTFAEINASKKLPGMMGGGSSTKISIEEGAIVIQGADSSKEELADEIMERIKRGSMDGEFIISTDGLRTT